MDGQRLDKLTWMMAGGSEPAGTYMIVVISVYAAEFRLGPGYETSSYTVGINTPLTC